MLLQPGDKIWWTYTERRGWSPTFDVPAVVVNESAKRVRIAAPLRDHVTKVVARVERTVTKNRVRPRDSAAEHDELLLSLPVT